MPGNGIENPVLDGAIDYGRVFVNFTEYTEQKITHGLIFEAVLRALKERGVVLQAGETTHLMDLGCGEGGTACEMIDAINQVHPQGDGVSYYGFDTDERFVASTERLLEEVKDGKHLRLIKVQQADVLSGKHFPLAAIDHALVTMGHVLYYAYSNQGEEATRQRIAEVVDSVDLRATLDQDNVLSGRSSYQLLLSRERSAGLRESVEGAVRSVEEALDGIVREAERAFEKPS